jgi:uncharacterized membrane protein YjgN (DUF898 family)
MESKFNGGVLELFAVSIGVWLICVITLGLGTPWAVCLYFNWLFKNSIIKGKQLKFMGSGGDLFIKFIVWWILCIITLGIYAMFWLPRNMIRWIVENTTLAE